MDFFKRATRGSGGHFAAVPVSGPLTHILRSYANERGGWGGGADSDMKAHSDPFEIPVFPLRRSLFLPTQRVSFKDVGLWVFCSGTRGQTV